MLLLNFNIISLNLGPFFGLLYGPLFLLYTKALIFADWKFVKADILYFIPVFIILIFLPFLQELLSLQLTEIVMAFGISLHMGIYLFLSHKKIIWFQRSLRNLTSELVLINLSWLRFLITSFAGLFVIVFIESLVSHNAILDEITIIIIYLFVLLFLNRIHRKGLRQPGIFSGITEENAALNKEIANRYRSSKLTEEEALAYMEELSAYMLESKPFLQFEITLDELAEKSNIPSRHLSQILNERHGKNFFDFINGYRVEEAKRKLEDNSLGLRVSEIIYSSGFNSKSTFNHVFKKNTGVTPSEYRRTHKKN